jgi:nucleoside-diphosphate-sugar epimerase
MSVLVIGGTGFVGAAVCDELSQRDKEVITASRTTDAHGSFLRHVSLDRRDNAELERTLRELEPDILVDLACYQPAEVEAVVRLFNGTRYIFMSTGVYPNLFGATATEEDFVPLAGDVPVDDLDYLDGKRWCETVLARNAAFPWTVIRPPAIFGARDYTVRVAAYIERILDGGPLLVPLETYEWRAGCAWVKDVGRATALACDPRHEPKQRAYNVSFGDVTFRRILEAFADALQQPLRLVPVPHSELPPGASPYGPDPRRAAGYDIGRARRELGFEPSPLAAAVADTLAWYHAEHPSHPDYAQRDEELKIAKAIDARNATR